MMDKNIYLQRVDKFYHTFKQFNDIDKENMINRIKEMESI